MTKRNSASTALALDDPDVLEIIFTYLPLEALLRTRPVNHDFAIAGRSRLIQIYRIISGGFDILQERGAFSKLREIWNKRVIFTGKEETAMIQLCDCLLVGAVPQLTDLYVYPCCRSDTVTALARACTGGALVHLQVSLPPTLALPLIPPPMSGVLPCMQTLDLSQNNIGDDGLTALVDAADGTLAQLQCLNLSNNVIGDSGLKYFANVCRGGVALRSLVQLDISRNKFGEPGLDGLAGALAGAQALVQLAALIVNHGPTGTEHPALARACNRRGIDMNPPYLGYST